MIVYQSDKSGFQRDVSSGDIDTIILEQFRRRVGHGVGESEVRSWHQSLTHMSIVLSDPEIPGDSGVSIELQIPQTAKRIDFLLTGQSDAGRDHAVIVELKQWESAEATGMDGIVRTWVGNGLREVSHPSYQAWSYAALLEDFNEAVHEGDIELRPCAFLHNFRDEGVLEGPAYRDHVERAPLFLKRDVEKLRAFIKRFVRHGDSQDILYRIDRGRIRPSKLLAESIDRLLAGNREFVMIDDQKVVFERALALARRPHTSPLETPRKRVFIVEGGPGTGKSVVAVNLLVELTSRREMAAYVTKNAAPRAVFESKLTGVMSRTRYSNLFQGSGGFIAAEPGTYEVLIVDEAHRLNEKSGLYQNLGDNQVRELIHAANTTVFFIDEDQRVTLRDIGTKDEIRHWARQMDAEIHEATLASQFRCNGSDGYLAWLDHTLQLRPTAHPTLEGVDYEVRVADTPSELRRWIQERNGETGRSRLVAGYCWRWKSKNDPSAFDIEFPEDDFRMRWNLAEDGSLWILKESSIHEVGCIHTCQGLEMDWVGVIIGPDLVVRDGKVLARPEARDRYDSTVRGYKKMLKEDPDRARSLGRAIVLNTYRTLMSRGMRGCYLYCTDEETRAWFRERIGGGEGAKLESGF